MKEKFKWVLRIVFILFIVSACNLFSIGMDKVDEVVSDIENLSDQISVDDIVEDIETVATDLPTEFENMEGEIDALLTEIPSELEDIGDIENLGDLGDIQNLIEDDLLSGETPTDIPILEDPKDILVESDAFISFVTTQDYESVIDFYNDQMPINGWVQIENNILNENSFLSIYKKDNRETTITINLNPIDNNTAVMIFIQSTD